MRSLIIIVVMLLLTNLYCNVPWLSQSLGIGSAAATPLGETLITIKPLRLHIEEYIRTTGQPPAGLSSLGITTQSLPSSQYISDVRVANDGSIRVLGRGKLGDDTVVALVPNLSAGTSSVSWNCLINNELPRYRQHGCQHHSLLRFDGATPR